MNHYLNERFDAFYKSYTINSLIDDFVKDKKSGLQRQSWGPLISPVMYKKALSEFVEYGKLIKFPAKHIYQWMGILIRNTIKFEYNNMLTKRIELTDYSFLEADSLNQYIKDRFNATILERGETCKLLIDKDYLSDALTQHILAPRLYFKTRRDRIVYEKQLRCYGEQGAELPKEDFAQSIKQQGDMIKRYNLHYNHKTIIADKFIEGSHVDLDENENIILTMNWMDLLNRVGFYEWLRLPDDSDGFSDIQLPNICKVINEYNEETSTPEQTLILINKVLDIYHARGDLSSMFIEGGARSLTKVSN